MMHLQPIVYVTNMSLSTDWYSRLLDRVPTMSSQHWTTFEVDGATLALHASDGPQGQGDVELSLVVDAPLEDIASRMSASAIDQQPFGRSCVVTDPDGVRIQVNEHHS